MDVYQLCEKLGGEIVRGRVRVRDGADWVEIGRNNGGTMEFTKAGTALARNQSENPSESAPKRRRRASKSEGLAPPLSNEQATPVVADSE